jgi:hypothetical protein
MGACPRHSHPCRFWLEAIRAISRLEKGRYETHSKESGQLISNTGILTPQIKALPAVGSPNATPAATNRSWDPLLVTLYRGSL